MKSALVALALFASAAIPADRTSHPRLVVKGVQERLVARGFAPGYPDGRWTSATTSAIREFQRAESLAATGEPDLATMQALFAKFAEEQPQIERVRGRDDGGAHAGFPRQTFGLGAACGFLVATALASVVALARRRGRQRNVAS